MPGGPSSRAEPRPTCAPPIVAHETVFHGSFHGTSGQVRTFGRQLAKYGRDAHAGVKGRILRDGSGRDLGYPAEHGPLDEARR